MKRFITEKNIVIIIFILLILRSIFFNSIIKIIDSPDLKYHVAVARIYKERPHVIFFWNSSNVNIPADDPVKYNPPVSTSPFLYHSIVGKTWFLFELLRFSDPYKSASLVQTIFGLLTIYFIYKIACVVTKDKYTRIFALIVASNIPMFSYQINYFSYDNLANLACTVSMYYLFSYVKNKKIRHFILLLIFMMIAALSKKATGPFLVIISVFLLFYFLKRSKTIIKDFYNFVSNKKNIYITLSFLITIILFLLFYGRNIVKYKAIFPPYSQILQFESNK